MKFAKSKAELEAAPASAIIDMENFVDYLGYSSALITDIAERFDYPTLWPAIDKLVEFTKKLTAADIGMRQAGYTSDDAYALRQYQMEEVSEGGDVNG